MSISRSVSELSDDAEKAIYTNLLTIENTHKVVLSNSIGMCIRTLYKKYFTTEEALNAGVQTCIAALLKIKSENVSLALQINYILMRINEPIDLLDRVTLYENNHKTIYIFPLKEVLTLTWKAIHDHEAFKKNYTGTQASQLSQATNDLPKRLETFFKTLNKARLEAVCHHGVRNDLIYENLNHRYEGITLIEDERAYILSYLKENMLPVFWQAYSETQDVSKKKILNQFLLQWISADDPQKIIEYVDKHTKLLKNLKQKFIANGIAPQDIKLDNLITQALPNLTCHVDPQRFPHLKILFQLFNTQSPYHANALQKIQDWILQSYEFADYQNKFLIDFNLIFSIANCLHKNAILLSFFQLENIEFLKNFCNHYLEGYTASGIFPVVSQEIKQHCETFFLAFKKITHDSLTDLIENFFKNYFDSINENNPSQFKRLYQLLLDSKIREKIIFDESYATVFLQSAIKSITPYEINRIFLTAILISSSDWQPKFFECLKLTFDYVASQFDHFKIDQDEMNAQSLLRDSYPDVLLAQLKYLIDTEKIRRDELQAIDLARPEMILIMPAQVRTYNEWRQIALGFSTEQHEQYYIQCLVMLEPLLHNELISLIDNSEDYSFFESTDVIQSIPLTKRNDFFRKFSVKHRALFKTLNIFLPWIKPSPNNCEHFLAEVNFAIKLNILDLEVMDSLIFNYNTEHCYKLIQDNNYYDLSYDSFVVTDYDSDTFKTFLKKIFLNPFNGISQLNAFIQLQRINLISPLTLLLVEKHISFFDIGDLFLRESSAVIEFIMQHADYAAEIVRALHDLRCSALFENLIPQIKNLIFKNYTCAQSIVEMCVYLGRHLIPIPFEKMQSISAQNLKVIQQVFDKLDKTSFSYSYKCIFSRLVFDLQAEKIFFAFETLHSLNSFSILQKVVFDQVLQHPAILENIAALSCFQLKNFERLVWLHLDKDLISLFTVLQSEETDLIQVQEAIQFIKKVCTQYENKLKTPAYVEASLLIQQIIYKAQRLTNAERKLIETHYKLLTTHAILDAASRVDLSPHKCLENIVNLIRASEHILKSHRGGYALSFFPSGSHQWLEEFKKFPVVKKLYEFCSKRLIFLEAKNAIDKLNTKLIKYHTQLSNDHCLLIIKLKRLCAALHTKINYKLVEYSWMTPTFKCIQIYREDKTIHYKTKTHNNEVIEGVVSFNHLKSFLTLVEYNFIFNNTPIEALSEKLENAIVTAICESSSYLSLEMTPKMVFESIANELMRYDRLNKKNIIKNNRYQKFFHSMQKIPQVNDALQAKSMKFTQRNFF